MINPWPELAETVGIPIPPPSNIVDHARARLVSVIENVKDGGLEATADRVRDADAAWIPSWLALDMMIETEKLIAALRDIAVYGRANPGYGYSCATKAIEALKDCGEQI